MDYSQIIIDTLNHLLQSLFDSIDHTLFALLDNIVFIDGSIIEDSFFDKAFGSNYQSGLILIANTLLVGFVLYYATRLVLASYSGNISEKPSQFLLKSVIISICISFSPFLCQQIIEINSLVCDGIMETGNHIFGITISFQSLINQLNSFLTMETFDFFSFSGLMKSFISAGLLSILFTYSLRYILIKIFILLSPFAFLTLTNLSSSWFFKMWLRNFLSLLLIQTFISLIFLIIFSFDGTFSSTFSQLMYFGSIYALTKSNQYVKELIGGISTDVQVNIHSLRSIFH